jgi:hypothetical protein
MPIDPHFLDMPCGINDPEAGDVGVKFAELQEQLVLISDVSPAVTLIKTFLESYRIFYCQLPLEQRENYPPNMALGSLFDLVVSAKYAERLVSDGGWTYCAGDNLSDGSSLYFCYLQTCPRCSVHKSIKPKVASNKPGSDTIGEICGDVTYEILSEIIRVNAPNIKIGKNRDRQADVDFVFYDANILALGETKSSPLVIYPLEVKLDKALSEVRDGQRVAKRDHTHATANISQAEILMYIPHRNLRINLGQVSTSQWLYQSLIQYVQCSENVAVLIAAWKELYDVYAANLLRGQTDSRKWITCGCGGGVDDSKNKPGMDRTDDIKKGTYQSLKFGTYYKEKDSRRIVRSLIASNFFPLRTFDRYLSEMTDVIWTKEKYSRTLSVDIPENFLTFSRNDLFYLYDAIICFTESIFMDDRLRAITSLDIYSNNFHL